MLEPLQHIVHPSDFEVIEDVAVWMRINGFNLRPVLKFEIKPKKIIFETIVDNKDTFHLMFGEKNRIVAFEYTLSKIPFPDILFNFEKLKIATIITNYPLTLNSHKSLETLQINAPSIKIIGSFPSLKNMLLAISTEGCNENILNLSFFPSIQRLSALNCHVQFNVSSKLQALELRKSCISNLSAIPTLKFLKLVETPFPFKICDYFPNLHSVDIEGIFYNPNDDLINLKHVKTIRLVGFSIMQAVTLDNPSLVNLVLKDLCWTKMPKTGPNRRNLLVYNCKSLLI